MQEGNSSRTTVGSLSARQARFDKGVDNQGWWAKKDRNYDENDNYAVGECKDCEGSSLSRNFFTFKLPKVDGKVVAARLVVRRYRAYGNVTETLDLYDVRTPARTLNHNRGRDVKIYRDLGRGARYGRYRVAQHEHCAEHGAVCVDRHPSTEATGAAADLLGSGGVVTHSGRVAH